MDASHSCDRGRIGLVAVVAAHDWSSSTAVEVAAQEEAGGYGAAAVHSGSRVETVVPKCTHASEPGSKQDPAFVSQVPSTTHVDACPPTARDPTDACCCQDKGGASSHPTASRPHGEGRAERLEGGGPSAEEIPAAETAPDGVNLEIQETPPGDCREVHWTG